MAEAAGPFALAIDAMANRAIAFEHLFARIRRGIGDGDVLYDGATLGGSLLCHERRPRASPRLRPH